MRLLPLTLALGLAATAAPAAGPITFDAGWREQRFALFSGNRFDFGGDRLSVRSDGTVSLVWTRLPEAKWGAQGASWRWTVAQSVPATDLRLRGGDDRNLAVYFVFLPEERARAARGDGIRRLLDAPDARVLVYVWGGPAAQPRLQDSPYLGPRGRTVALRSAGTGAAMETVDLAADHRAAFGTAPGALVGLAISADSDDTASAIRAEIADFVLR